MTTAGSADTASSTPQRLLLPTAALLWGLQFSFLNPALALLLVTLYGATPAQVGWALAVYNASGFVASVLVPAYADRRHEYLRPMLVCGALTAGLAGVLALASSLPVALVGLIVFGGPAGVGVSLLFAHLKHTGAVPSVMVNIRAVVSFAWVAGPPVATFIIGTLGNRAILVAIVVVALLNVGTTAAMLARRSTAATEPPAATEVLGQQSVSRVGVVVIVVAFIALQATNAAVVSVMNLFVTQRLHLDVLWAGVALAVAAGLEIPALLVMGRLSRRFSNLGLIASGCVAGIGYYVAMAFVAGPVPLIALQVLNAWFFAAVAGVGMTLFLDIIPRPGLASGLYTNTRRLGAIVSGPVIGFGSTTSLGYSGIFPICAGLTLAALIAVQLVGRAARTRVPPATTTSGMS